MHQIRHHFRYGRANDPRNMFMESPQFLHRLSVASRTSFQDWSQDRGDPSRPEPLLESDRLDMGAQHVGRWGCGDKGEQFTFSGICGIGEPLLAFPSPFGTTHSMPLPRARDLPCGRVPGFSQVLHTLVIIPFSRCRSVAWLAQ